MNFSSNDQYKVKRPYDYQEKKKKQNQKPEKFNFSIVNQM